MNALRRFLLWLAGRNNPARPADPPLLPPPPEVEVIPHDAALLERARMQWMMGDWQALSRVERDAVMHHPERAPIAAYVGAGLQQLSRHEEAQTWLEQAKDWGCTRKLLAEVLLSGVYYTLARAALVAGDRPRALLNLKESIEVGMPGHDVALLARARINAQAQMPGADLLDWGTLDNLELVENSTTDLASTIREEPLAPVLSPEPVPGETCEVTPADADKTEPAAEVLVGTVELRAEIDDEKTEAL